MIPPVPVLTTRRLRLRGLREADVAALWPSFSDTNAMRYWSRAAFTSQAELRDWLFDDKWGGRSWIAEPLDGGDAVGRVVAHHDMHGAAEIGYLTALGHERQGIARECTAALIDHLVADGHTHRIWADVDPRNAASNQLLKSLGFTKEGHLRETMKTHIGWCDSLIWGLLASEWQQQVG